VVADDGERPQRLSASPRPITARGTLAEAVAAARRLSGAAKQIANSEV
jgi:hypothetical protein